MSLIRSIFLSALGPPRRTAKGGLYSRNQEHIPIHDNSIKNRSDCQSFSENHSARIRTNSAAHSAKYWRFHRKGAEACRKRDAFMQNPHCVLEFFTQSILQICRRRDKIALCSPPGDTLGFAGFRFGSCVSPGFRSYFSARSDSKCLM